MFVIDVQEYMVDWDWEQNNAIGLNPNTLTTQSKKRVYWVCHICGGKWDTQMKERHGCPYCSNFKVLRGYNDLATLRPDLAKQWSYKHNGSLTPQDVTSGSRKKVYWICEKGHVWEAQIHSRVEGRGCPYCTNRRVLTGYNDLSTIKPSLVADWDYSKNTGLTPEKVLFGSKQKIWWKCHICDFEWEASILDRSRGNGCPSCAHVCVHKGKNDLLTVKPLLAKEWDYEKNSIRPDEVAMYSRKRVAWKCSKGHSFFAVVSDRVKGSGCPICNQERQVSFPEKALLYYIKKEYKNVIGNFRAPWLHNYELDIFIPEYKIGIEYDGVYGHSTKTGIERDKRKNKICSDNNIILIRIREPDCLSLQSTSIDYLISKEESIDATIFNVLQLLHRETKKTLELTHEDIDTKNDSGDIYSLIEYSEKEKSIKKYAPNIAQIWHPVKNGNLTPDQVSIMSAKKVWWLGKCGHEWQSIVSNEIKRGLCPYCTGKRILLGFNDLVTTNPALAQEWDYEKNNPYKPEDFTSGSGKKVWWKCNKGHSWYASITSRNHGNGCPICANRNAVQGYNDVASSTLLADWDYDNNDVKPEEVCIGSKKKYQWLCHICGYKWSASVSNRYHGRGCPQCTKRQRSTTVKQTYVKRSGSLEEKRPDLMEEWDWDKNTNIKPSLVTCGCMLKVWWKCKKCGYLWEASINSRTRDLGVGCPKCADKIRAQNRQKTLLNKKPPISDTHTELISEWYYDKNNALGIFPEMLTAGSNKRVWWKCPKCGTVWNAVICERTRGRGKCPKCRNELKA